MRIYIPIDCEFCGCPCEHGVCEMCDEYYEEEE